MRKLFVLIAAVAFVAALTAPAFAAEWSFYGSARMTTFWYQEDKDYSSTGKKDTDLTWDLQGNSRFGANVKAGDITGAVEFGMANSDVSNRILWGEYDFGSFKLGIGQNYSPMNFFISNQVAQGDADMLPYGGIYSGRNPMIRFRFGNLDIALVEPDAPSYSDYSAAGSSITCVDVDGELTPTCSAESGCVIDTDVYFPRLEARYGLNLGAFYLEFGGGVQSYDVVGRNPVNGKEGNDEAITSWLGYVGAKFNSGPFYFGADAWIGQNTGNMTLNFGDQPVDDALVTCANPKSPSVKDNDLYGLLGVVAFTANDMLRFEGGVGWISADRSDFDKDDETLAYYVQASINLGKGIILVPEVGIIDLRDNPAGDSEGKITYWGAKWQINF